jgi:hypothetical protein
MLYSVKYKKPGDWFFRTIKNVKGDGISEGSSRSRYFILHDETRIELPCSCHFIFSKGRFELIKSMMEQQAGQAIPVAW